MRPPVIAIIIAAAVIGYCVGVWIGNERHDLDRDRLQFANDQITAYRDRLQGATPDEAAKRFSTLESALADASRKINRLSPTEKRKLSDKDKDFIKLHASEIQKIVPSPFPVFGMSLGDSIWYAKDFVEAFQSNGIRASGPILTPCDDNQSGILVGVKNPASPPRNAMKFFDILTDMGVHPALTVFVDAANESSFDLFVCAEPIDRPIALPSGPAPPAPPAKK